MIERLVLFLARLFPTRYRALRRADGNVFFRQFKVLSVGKEEPRGVPPWYHVSIFFQSFMLPDDPDSFHIHRWRRMVSFVLSGELTEERDDGLVLKHVAPCIYTMGSEVVHRAAGVTPQTWTLFVMLGRNKLNPPGGWGYLSRTGGGYLPWDTVRSPDVKPL